MAFPADLLIRTAMPSDATEIADVHIRAWREQYLGILPETYVEHLTLNFPRRVEMWRDIIALPKQSVLLVAEVSSGVIGYAYFRPAPDVFFDGFAQLDSIYLLAEFKGRGIGDRLMAYGFEILMEHGFQKAYCWVLEGHRSTSFFERMGARRDMHGKTSAIEGQPVQQVAYVWDDLTSLPVLREFERSYHQT